MIVRSISFRVCLLAASLACDLPATEFKAPPGAYHTSWVGNSFPGDGGPNGFGYWVSVCIFRGLNPGAHGVTRPTLAPATPG